MELRLLSVNVGQIRIIGTRNGEPLPSAFRKEPVSAGSIGVKTLGLDGDVQANLRVHGGPDKAVYAYPSDHWTWWEKEQRFPCRPGSAFGENLSTEGADESEVRLGDRFAWGDAILEITQPRSPCHKFVTVSGRQDAGQLMTDSGRCGFYFRVLREGSAPVKGGVLARISTSDNPSVRDAFRAVFARPIDEDLRARVLATPTLAAAWRERFV